MMNRILYYTVCLLICSFLVACSEKKEAKDEKRFYLENKIAQPDEQLQLTDFCSSVEYIPLETNDSCLIGKEPVFKLYKDKVIVGSSQNRCLVFDRHTGKFIRAIGSCDKGPRGYASSANFWINEQTGIIYFKNFQNNFVKYTIDGTFAGEQIVPSASGSASRVDYLNADTLVIYHKEFLKKSDIKLSYFDKEGKRIKSFPNTAEGDSMSMNEIKMVAVFKANVTGIFGFSGETFLLATGKEPDKETLEIGGQRVFWHIGGKVYFKESFNDTIYRLTSDAMIADKILDMGKYGLSPAEAMSKAARKEKTTIDCVQESERYMMFTYWKKMTDRNKTYRGIVDKQTGEVWIAELGKGITDDLNHFMDLNPYVLTAENEFVGYLEPLQILKWFEEKDAGQLPADIQKLKNIQEDDNQVLVILKAKV